MRRLTDAERVAVVRRVQKEALGPRYRFGPEGARFVTYDKDLPYLDPPFTVWANPERLHYSFNPCGGRTYCGAAIPDSWGTAIGAVPQSEIQRLCLRCAYQMAAQAGRQERGYYEAPWKMYGGPRRKAEATWNERRNVGEKLPVVARDETAA